MPSKQIVFHGIAISQEKRGDAFMGYHVITPEEGLRLVLKRQTVKPNSGTQLDLFDEGEFTADLKTDSNTAFLKEFHLQTRRTEIASNYTAFQLSVRFCKLILRNPTHEENSEAIYHLVKKALDAWPLSSTPEAIYIKSLYLYCRDEGYPMNEEWYSQLSPQDAQTVKQILNTPAKDIALSSNQMRDCIESLETYVERSTHIETAW